MYKKGINEKSLFISKGSLSHNGGVPFRLNVIMFHVDINRLNVNTLYIILHVDEFYRVCREKVCHHIISYHPYHYHCYYYMFIILSHAYPDITHGIHFSYTTAVTSQWIITQYC